MRKCQKCLHKREIIHTIEGGVQIEVGGGGVQLGVTKVCLSVSVYLSH